MVRGDATTSVSRGDKNFEQHSLNAIKLLLNNVDILILERRRAVLGLLTFKQETYITLLAVDETNGLISR